MILLLWAGWRRESESHQRAVGVGSLVLTGLVAAAVVAYLMADVSAGRGAIAVDRFRWIADLVFLLGTGFTVALSMDYNRRQGITSPETHVLVLFATSGMMLLAAARDLMIVFLGIEVMSIAVYALSAVNRRSVRGAEGALKYFLLGAFSTAFLLYGIALVYGATGATELLVIGERISEFGLSGSPILLAGIALLLVGFAFKVAAAPFHMWAPDVYEGAPTPITAYMAASVKAAAFAAFLRVWLEAFPLVAEHWHTAVVALAVVTMIGGNVIALSQRNIKRLLAYSSIAHAGYVLIAVAVGSRLGAAAFLFYLTAYTLATMGAFGVVVALGNEGESNLHVDDYSGLWTTRPWLAAAMAIFMLALLGFPVFGGIGFFAKWYLLEATLAAPNAEALLAITLVLTSVVSAGYYLYVVMVMFMRPHRDGAFAGPRAGGLTKLVVGAAALLILAFGVYPEPLVRLTRRATAAVIGQQVPSARLPEPSAVPLR
ncbi:MAG: NADH-quinone oxidoreductase subunit N [Gemmatimonadaceae bacterium]